MNKSPFKSSPLVPPGNFFKKIVGEVVEEKIKHLASKEELKQLAAEVHELEGKVDENERNRSVDHGKAIGMLADVLARLTTREEQAEMHQLKHDDMGDDLEKLKAIHLQDPNNPSRFVHV